MRYTVKDLLESGQFPEMKLISGESELNREIKGARLLEVANMECFLSGDEILFTSLKAYENVDLQEFVKHLEGLKKKQISAFIVKRDQQTELQRIRFNILHNMQNRNKSLLSKSQRRCITGELSSIF